MSRYNIYKIKDGQVGGLRDHLTNDRRYLLAGSYTSGNYLVRAYFAGPDETDMWWLAQYALYFGDYTQRRNQVYSGAIVAQSNIVGGPSYIIPLGKTHFYIQNFIEIGFGLDLAEKIANNSKTKMKGLKSFGGKTSKSLTSYTTAASLIFSGGETAEYLKLKAQNTELWGSAFIHFGTSAQFNSIEVLPENLGPFFAQIETAMAGPRLFRIPLMKEITDPAMLLHKYSDLANRILTGDNTIGVLDYEVYGVDFVFSQQTHLRLKCREIESEPFDALTLAEVTRFVRENNINISEQLRDIKIQILVDGQSQYTTPLVNVIDYYADDRTFLYRGKWFNFNETFIQSLHESLSRIPVVFFGTRFIENNFQTWRASNPAGVKYRERYVISEIHRTHGYEIIDRVMDYPHFEGKTYSMEVGDLYDQMNEQVYVVKIGKPDDFGYAFDQASIMLNNLSGNRYVYTGGRNISVKKVTLLLLFQTNRELNSATDTQSIIFEMKLNELFKLAQEKNVVLDVQHSTIL